MAAAADRLSVLPDAVLHRVLSFAEAKDAAATSALSRRWRPLWHQTTAVNLDSRPYRYHDDSPDPKYDAFFSHAHAAFRHRSCRPGSPIRRGYRRSNGDGGERGLIMRLTLSLEIGAYRSGRPWKPDPEDDGRATALLADPAVAGLEELRISCEEESEYSYHYGPPLSYLPCAATLRVLELRRCKLDSPPPTTTTTLALPRLTDLQLHGCFLQEGCLQALVDAAPGLTTLSLLDVLHTPAGGSSAEERRRPRAYDHDTQGCSRLPLRLRCPALTAFFLQINPSESGSKPDADSGIELDMPSLRFFRYRGFPVKLSLTSPAPALERVDMYTRHHGHYLWKLEPTSRMLRSFSSMRALKLRLDLIEDIVTAAAGGDAEEEGGLPTFPNLKLLELDAEYQYKESGTAAAMAWLLGSCPAMADLLRLSLDMQWDYHHRERTKAACGPFGVSMDRFQRLASMSAAHRGVVELGEVSELPAAMTTSSCLGTSLRKVTLRFKAKEVNCFQVQLARFLAENAMVLEEMHVDNGSWFWPDHLCHKVPRWRAESFKKRKLMDTAGFRRPT
ncbi:hypothetical protein BRADI_1g17745v3 [Brachypodium distachyon]|uniref:F-box domain-containing protein n=1 Tax=Brachypodium distachyon TaxID=15368 RepID=A0A0Q3GUG4_BRADI|nr:hypothetical protein BRADI_1g17745v3 [Brachypodium distachyon]